MRANNYERVARCTAREKECPCGPVRSPSVCDESSHQTRTASPRPRPSRIEILVLVDPRQPKRRRALLDREAVVPRRLLQVLLAALAVCERERDVLLRIDVAEVGGELEVRDGLRGGGARVDE